MALYVPISSEAEPVELQAFQFNLENMLCVQTWVERSRFQSTKIDLDDDGLPTMEIAYNDTYFTLVNNQFISKHKDRQFMSHSAEEFNSKYRRVA